jgi:hypothetical protein
MTKVLCTFPGQIGDLLWALPTVRALSEAYGAPVDLAIPVRYQHLKDLLHAQGYLHSVHVLGLWDVQLTAPMGPRVPPAEAMPLGYDRVYHLGYDGWPEPTLAMDIFNRAVAQYCLTGEGEGIRTDFREHHLGRPWITPAPPVAGAPYVWVGWSEEWLELKMGVLFALANRFPEQEFRWVVAPGGRYEEFARVLPGNVTMWREGWMRTATIGSRAACYLGCLSSQWVLANALGQRCVVMEPGEARWHPTFWRESPLNVLVRGNDDRPTFDARHIGDALEEVLRASL